MLRYFKNFRMLFCWGFIFGAVFSPQYMLAQSPGEQIMAFNRLAARRAELMVKVRQYDQDLATIWRNPALSSPDIDDLRRRLVQLESEMLITRKALKDAIAKLPEVKNIEKEREGVLKEAEQLKGQLDEMRKKRRVTKTAKAGQ